jgi:amino acid transporter
MSETKLVRGISRFDLTAIAINSIIGAGIFGLPSKVAALIGGYSLLAFIVCALIVALIVLCFAEVSSRFAETGGSYLYAHKAFGRVVGFEVGWLFWLVRITAFATNCNLLVGYMGFLFPFLNESLPRILLICGVVIVLTWINLLGIRESATLTNFFTVGKLLPMFAFAIIGLFFIHSANYNFSVAPETGAFANAVLLLVYAFTGFEMAVVPAGEMKDPQKNIPFALLTAIGVVAALYILIQIVCIGTLPELAASERPLADSAQRFLGTYGAAVITIGAIISIFGNLNSLILSASRIPFAMAEQKDLPPILAQTSARFKTPLISLFLTATVILIFTIQTSFLTALTISTITRLMVYATTCAALPVFRFNRNAPAASFLAPLGVFASIASLILIVWLLINVKQNEFVNVAIVAAAGLILCFGFGIYNKSKQTKLSDG